MRRRLAVLPTVVALIAAGLLASPALTALAHAATPFPPSEACESTGSTCYQITATPPNQVTGQTVLLAYVTNDGFAGNAPIVFSQLVVAPDGSLFGTALPTCQGIAMVPIPAPPPGIGGSGPFFEADCPVAFTEPGTYQITASGFEPLAAVSVTETVTSSFGPCTVLPQQTFDKDLQPLDVPDSSFGNSKFGAVLTYQDTTCGKGPLQKSFVSALQCVPERADRAFGAGWTPVRAGPATPCEIVKNSAQANVLHAEWTDELDCGIPGIHPYLQPFCLSLSPLAPKLNIDEWVALKASGKPDQAHSFLVISQCNPFPLIFPSDGKPCDQS